MAAPSRLAVVLAVAVALVAAGCGGEGGDETAATFGRDDLPNLVLKRNEAPPTTSFSEPHSGTQRLEQLEPKKKWREQFEELGFEGGYNAVFLSPSGTAGRRNIVFATAIATAWRDEDAAHEAFLLLKEEQETEGEDVRELGTATLGDESFGLRGRFNVGAPPTYLFGWRVDNAVLAFAMGGGPGLEEGDAVAWAHRMDNRARAARDAAGS